MCSVSTCASNKINSVGKEIMKYKRKTKSSNVLIDKPYNNLLPHFR